MYSDIDIEAMDWTEAECWVDHDDYLFSQPYINTLYFLE